MRRAMNQNALQISSQQQNCGIFDCFWPPAPVELFRYAAVGGFLQSQFHSHNIQTKQDEQNKKAIGTSGGTSSRKSGDSGFGTTTTARNAAERKAAQVDGHQGHGKGRGEKIAFLAAGDAKVRDVVNPDALKDHVGHHVELSAHVYADKGQIHVMKVTML